MVQRLSADWSAAYGHSLLLDICRSIQILRAYYKAAGWTRLGQKKAMPARTVDIRTRTGFEGLTCFSAAPRYQKSHVCPGSFSRPLAAEPDGGRLRAAASRFELCL